MNDEGYTRDMAARYWQLVHLPIYQGFGLDGQALYVERDRYLDAIDRSPEAQRQLVDWAETGYDPDKTPR